MFFDKKIIFNEKDLQSVLSACLARNQQAERTLITLFLGYSKSICIRYASSEQEAEEIINDGFLKVFSNLSKYDSAQSFRAWLRKIMVNTAIDYYRSNEKYRLNSTIDAGSEVTDFDPDVLTKISADEIMVLVQKLPPAYRMVFMLHVVEGYNHREIAERLGVQEGTSKSNLRDARLKLQQMIKVAHPELYDIYALRNRKINEN